MSPHLLQPSPFTPSRGPSIHLINPFLVELRKPRNHFSSFCWVLSALRNEGEVTPLEARFVRESPKYAVIIRESKKRFVNSRGTEKKRKMLVTSSWLSMTDYVIGTERRFRCWHTEAAFLLLDRSLYVQPNWAVLHGWNREELRHYSSNPQHQDLNSSKPTTPEFKFIKNSSNRALLQTFLQLVACSASGINNLNPECHMSLKKEKTAST